MQEEVAGRLITCAEWILSGHLSLEVARKFRTLNSSHIYEKLAPNDRKSVDGAVKILQEKYGEKVSVNDFEFIGPRTS